MYVYGGLQVVDAALGLKEKGHEVTIITSHHSAAHSFAETNDGQLNVIVHGTPYHHNRHHHSTIMHASIWNISQRRVCVCIGDWMPRHVAGRLHLLCAASRSFWAASAIVASGTSRYDIIFVDQISLSIPILRLTRARILFYCHHPDKLLTTRSSVLKKLYRWPLDLAEEITTGNYAQPLCNTFSITCII